MKPALPILAIAVVVGSLIASTTAAQQRPAEKAKGFERRQIIAGPVLESATHDTAIIRWTANTAGGTAKHYGIVRYATDPRSLDHTARSASRWNENLPDMTYRVQIDGLTPATTYYYTVDAAQADGIGMGLKSTVNQFTTRPSP